MAAARRLRHLCCARRGDVHSPEPRDDAASLQRRLQSPLNGSRNLWRFDISALLRARHRAGGGCRPGPPHFREETCMNSRY